MTGFLDFTKNHPEKDFIWFYFLKTIFGQITELFFEIFDFFFLSSISICNQDLTKFPHLVSKCIGKLEFRCQFDGPDSQVMSFYFSAYLQLIESEFLNKINFGIDWCLSPEIKSRHFLYRLKFTRSFLNKLYVELNSNPIKFLNSRSKTFFLCKGRGKYQNQNESVFSVNEIFQRISREMYF